MKTLYVMGGPMLGFKINNVKELVMAQDCNFGICDKEYYYYDDIVTRTDENGQEYEDNPTDREIFNRLVDALTEGTELFAVASLEDGMTTVERKRTTLQSDFGINQEVYVLVDNKIKKGNVSKVQLLKALDTGGNLCVRKRIALRFPFDRKEYPFDEEDVFESKEQLVKHLMEEE